MSKPVRPDMRAHVLKAALQAIEELGFDRLRVQDIADRAGMSTGHVLYYFGSRDRILISTLLLSEADLDERRRTGLAGLAPRAALAEFVALYLPRGADDVRWRLWAQAIARPPEDDETLLKLDGFFRAWAGELAGILRACAPVADPDELAARACRLMDGLASEVLLRIPGHDAAWARATALAAIEAGLS
ncbi:TetR/AcrR family transcriptional regulator [Nonomuraea sp. NPDC050310]|uniref:TetR/AcrR family transcriptional regulator n=1 Tax=unclassified Nonomuraea TaxID=2593643 RepID=UPI0033CB00D8